MIPGRGTDDMDIPLFLPCIGGKKDLVVKAEGMTLLRLLVGRSLTAKDTSSSSHLLVRSAGRILGLA
jgi:hypothetical protein